jgi:HEPN domain-containing protein
VNSNKDVEYRLNLAKGFLDEAEQDFELRRWRSCVDNSQLAVENAGKSILTLFGIPPKTHEPAKHLARLINDSEVPSNIRDAIKNLLPDFLTLGVEEHFMTDYGDESSYTLPWEMFNEESARSALQSARLCASESEKIIQLAHQWRKKKII